jgi:hypothetical protein
MNIELMYISFLFGNNINSRFISETRTAQIKLMSINFSRILKVSDPLLKQGLNNELEKLYSL